MRLFIFFAGLLVMSGCSSNAYPQFYAGKYYMMGDESCQFVRPLSETRVMCMDEDKNEMGYRDALTYEQLSMYQAQVELSRVQMESLSQTLNDVNQSLQRSNQSTYQFTPIEQPSFSYGTSGTTYRRVGNTVIGSDGSKCQIVGSNWICN